MDHVQPKVIRFLEILVQNKNRLVSHDTLIEALWDGNYLVGRQGIIRTVNKLRRTIEDEPTNPSVIISYYGQGYLFASNATATMETPQSRTPSFMRTLATNLFARFS